MAQAVPVLPDTHREDEVFDPGTYVYNFQLPLDNDLPESIRVRLGKVKYSLEVFIERPGVFHRNLHGSREVRVVRTPTLDSWGGPDLIARAMAWEDRAHYQVIVTGSSFPQGSPVPISFQFMPLSKVRCLSIRVRLNETVEIWTRNGLGHQKVRSAPIVLLDRSLVDYSSDGGSATANRDVSGV